MAIVSLPLTAQLANGTTADATQVMADLNAIANAVNAYAVALSSLADTTNGASLVGYNGTDLKSFLNTFTVNPTGILSINGTAIAGLKNQAVNGIAEVAQNTSTVNLTTSAKYGQVDMVTMWASGGAVSAGTLTQNTSAAIGRTGKAARAAGVTLTGSGQLSWRYRQESVDAVKLKNKNASFQIAVIHDVGSTINYTIIVRKPTVSDNYSSTTVISTSSALPVVSATGTVLNFQAVAMGDCSNGFEVEVQAACGAVTTKNFDFTEFQIEEGSACTAYEYHDYNYELARCKRFLPAYMGSGSNDLVCAGMATSTTLVIAYYPFDVMPRVAPTGVTTSGNFSVLNSSGGGVATTSVAFSSLTCTKVGALSCSVAAGLTAGNGSALLASTGKILFTGSQL